MPKRKKPKTYHNQYDLSHEEIWDDSALIRSWEEAVQEYEYYQSIAARGEDVEEVLRAAEEAEMEGEGGVGDGLPVGMNGDDEEEEEEEKEGEVWEGNNGVAGADSNAAGHEGLDDEVEDGEVDESLIPNSTSDRLAEPPPPVQKQVHGRFQPDHDGTSRNSLPSVPVPTAQTQPVLFSTPAQDQSTDQIQAQTLENIKMAYYWAGYYSGLYEGQRQAATAQSKGK